jgi:hypothetical protein
MTFGLYPGGRETIMPHPSQQVKVYHNHMQDFDEDFDKEPTL